MIKGYRFGSSSYTPITEMTSVGCRNCRKTWLEEMIHVVPARVNGAMMVYDKCSECIDSGNTILDGLNLFNPTTRDLVYSEAKEYLIQYGNSQVVVLGSVLKDILEAQVTTRSKHFNGKIPRTELLQTDGTTESDYWRCIASASQQWNVLGEYTRNKYIVDGTNTILNIVDGTKSISSMERPPAPKVPIQPVNPEPLEKCDRPECKEGGFCLCIIHEASRFVIGVGAAGSLLYVLVKAIQYLTQG